MASHGGFVGVLLALTWFARKYHYSFCKLGDVIVTLAPLGLCFGRIANFINGELWGRVTEMRWAVVFPEQPQWSTIQRCTFSLRSRAIHRSCMPQSSKARYSSAYAQWRFWRTQSACGAAR